MKFEDIKQIKEKTERTIHTKSENSNLFLNIFIVFLIIFSVSLALRITYDMIVEKKSFKEILLINSAEAAELENQAQLVMQSHTHVNIRPNTGFTFTLKYLNTGTSTWTKQNVYLKSLTTALKFRHTFWPDPFLPAQLKESTVAPGEYGTFVFALDSPTNLNNNYSGDFVLVNDNVMIQGGKATVTMQVVENPENIGDFSRRGALILQKDNPSGLPEHDDALEISIRFE